MPPTWTAPIRTASIATASPLPEKRMRGSFKLPSSRAVPLDEPDQAPPGSASAPMGSPAQETSSPHGNGGTKPHVPRARSQPPSRFSSARSKKASAPAVIRPSSLPDSKRLP